MDYLNAETGLAVTFILGCTHVLTLGAANFIELLFGKEWYNNA